MDVLINEMGGILSQCTHISNHHDVHFKRLVILCQLYLNKAEIIGLKKKKKKKTGNDPNIIS